MSYKVNVACKLPNGLQLTVDGKTVVLKGANDREAVLGFGITRDVDGDFFKKWTDRMGKFPALKNGSIFAYSGDIGDAIEERAEDGDVMTGMEPLNAEKPMPGIEPTDETKKAIAEAGGQPRARGSRKAAAK